MKRREKPAEVTPELDKDRRDDDSLWKDIVERFFYPMLKRAIPTLYADAETKTLPRFLDKELKKATYRLRGGKRSVDLLAEVPLKDGSCEWVLLHIEIQGRGGGRLPFRMAYYRALIFAMYKREAAALAIVTEKRSKDEPKFYESELYNTSVVYRYNRLVVPELDEGELLASDNPFDLALCAAQRALKSRRDERQKHAYLKELLRLLGERGWDHEDKRRLLLFIENIIGLKDRELKLDIVKYEEELQKEGKIVYQPLIVEMKYGPQWEEKAKLKTARNLLKMGLTVEQIATATELPEEDVRKLLN